MDILLRAYSKVRNFLLRIINKEFLIFLFFFALSGVFWLQLTLNDTYEREYMVPVKLTNVPQNVVLTSEEEDTVKVTLKDKGFQLLSYMFSRDIHTISVNFKQFARNNGRGVIAQAELQKAVYQQLSPSTKIVAVKPERVEFYYNYGLHKRVPVKWTGHVQPEVTNFISQVGYLPDSVDVYATEDKLDSISVVTTEALNITNFRDTLTVRASLSKMKGVKTVPNKVTVTFYTDVLTEENMEGVPIQGINVPEGKVIRTFPAKATVHFVTGVNRYKKLRKSDFSVVVDYNEIVKNASEKCTLHLRMQPHGISRVTVTPQTVDYLIEEE